ncbi:MAG: hypothetical protein M1836_002890 [Candelina mexicana]|nr:MAG: hypothetical protein M1836_002890 [Candelina mexicana]
MPQTLPSPRAIISSLFEQLPKQGTEGASSSAILKELSAKNKQLLLTIHCLFPNEFLPALDLLDRQLITRFLIEQERDLHPNSQTKRERSGLNTVYYVRSAQPNRISRYQNYYPGAGLSYEVRLQAWNCSCPAFTFSAFSALPTGREDGFDRQEDEIREQWSFGGLTAGQDAVPICKHLLACVMIEQCGLLSGCVDEKDVGRDEAAGWGAGWGG